MGIFNLKDNWYLKALFIFILLSLFFTFVYPGMYKYYRNGSIKVNRITGKSYIELCRGNDSKLAPKKGCKWVEYDAYVDSY